MCIYISAYLQLTTITDVLGQFDSSIGPNTEESSASSLQSGLISVVLKGDDNYFKLIRASQFRMELDDVV